ERLKRSIVCCSSSVIARTSRIFGIGHLASEMPVLYRNQLVDAPLMAQATQTVRIYPSAGLHGTVRPPSSKYHTLRYIVAAMLARSICIVNDPAVSDDTRVLLRACEQLGVPVRFGDAPLGPGASQSLIVNGTGGQIKAPPGGILDVGNAGAVLRLMLSICALSPETITLTTPYAESLGRRPNADLLEALRQLGASIESSTAEGTLPISIRGGKLRGGKLQISGKKSSQYISSLLFLAPLLEDGLEIEIIDGLTSANFVDLTIRVLEEAGIAVLTRERHRYYIVPGKQQYQPREYTIPGDYPSAAALLAAIATAKDEISIANLQPDDADGELLLEIFSRMGVQIIRDGYTITARMHEPLRGIDLNGNLVIDSVPVIAAALCFAQGKSRIYNIANLRYKESDRINDLAMELNKLGCRVIAADDALEIEPTGAEGAHGGVSVDAHADHRLVQALTIAGLASKQPVMIEHAEHISKSYPRFFADLSVLGARIEWV
ncbi:MAG TPA: 3-phosphoshikimate 1-carboxyvinyltransferase, partial [Ktedonobacteraceae bacterium]|nr:3-phosphoshikimate 1-carboxyvinyltransferase [Ktedonobacteraceae bacterium]